MGIEQCVDIVLKKKNTLLKQHIFFPSLRIQNWFWANVCTSIEYKIYISIAHTRAGTQHLYTDISPFYNKRNF